MFDNIFKIVFLIGFLAISAVRVTGARPQNKQRQTSFRKIGGEWPLLILSFLGMMVIPLIYVFTPWLDFADYPHPGWVSWLGLLALAAGAWLLWRTHRDLGRNWSGAVEIKQRQTLVTQGVYSRIRHPMYAAHWLWALAQALILPNWIAGPAFLVGFLPLYLVRTPREEATLIEGFGDEYRQYMARTGRVIPKV